MGRHADAAAQPPIRNVRTQPGRNGMSAGEALHLPIHPQRQQQPRVHRRTTCVMGTGADGTLKVRHVQRFDSCPDGADWMTSVNQLLIGPSRQHLSPFRPEHTHSRPSAPRHGESCSHCGAYASSGHIRSVNFFSRPQPSFQKLAQQFQPGVLRLAAPSDTASRCRCPSSPTP